MFRSTPNRFHLALLLSFNLAINASLLPCIAEGVAGAAKPEIERNSGEHKRPVRTPEEERHQTQATTARQALTNKESTKTTDPANYISALLAVFNAEMPSTRSRTGTTDPQPDTSAPEEFFLRALDCFEKSSTKLTSTDGYESVVKLVWRNSARLTIKTFSNVFDRLCKASNKLLAEQNADGEILDAICRSHRGISATEVRQFLQRAIDIRKAALGEHSPGLLRLMDRMSVTCEHSSDLAAAEKFRLEILACDLTPQSEVHELLGLSEFYYRINKPDKAEVAWRKALAVAIKGKVELGPQAWFSLVKILEEHTRADLAEQVVDAVVTQSNLKTLKELEPLLVTRYDAFISSANFPKAEQLVKKRLAAPSANSSVDNGDWRVRLSNVYLMEGKSKQSQTMFDQILASLALQSIPTDSLIKERGALLKSLGKPAESAKLLEGMPKASVTKELVLPASMMAKTIIRFGHNTSISSYDSNDKSSNDPYHRVMPTIPSKPGEPLDQSVIICKGQVVETSNFSYDGTIASSRPDVSPHPLRKVIQVPANIEIQDAISPPPTALTAQLSHSGTFASSQNDRVVTDFERTAAYSAPGEDKCIRLFLQDTPGKSEFELPYGGRSSVSYRQSQVWYNGSKKLNVRGFSGLLYAPNAVVHLEFNGSFRGVLVAREIDFEGNNSIMLDRAVVGKNLNP